MVSDARTGGVSSAGLRQKDSGNYNYSSSNLENAYNSQPYTTKSSEYVRKQSGGATYGNKVETDLNRSMTDTGGNTAAAHKMRVLADSDKETIQQQQKKLQVLKYENEQLKQKYASLKRNFESISTYAAKDKEESEKILAMKTEYEKEIEKLN